MEQYSKVGDTVEYINKNLDDKISLDELSQKAHLSKYHYHRIFHKITGESVGKYITKRRMEKAAEELAETDEPIIDIAFKYQYSSQESFTRAFMRIYNLTPGKYRKIYLGNRSDNNVILFNSNFSQITDMAA
jgi:AraC-type DNA-binding domain-containing proteins